MMIEQRLEKLEVKCIASCEIKRDINASDRNEWNCFRKDNTRAGPVAPYSDGRRIRAAMFRAAMPRLSCGRIERSFRRGKKKPRYFVRFNRLHLQFLIIESILILILPDKKIHIFKKRKN